MKIERLEIFPVHIPVRELQDGGIAPYRGSKDAEGVREITSVIFKLTSESGQVGWGEMNFIYSLHISECMINDFLKPLVVGADVFERNRIMMSCESLYNPDINTLHLASGVEMALWDLQGKELHCPVYQLLGGKVRDRIPVAYAVGYLDMPETKEKIREICREGYGTIKTKGGFHLENDIERAHLMREAAGPDVEIRVDMNQAYRMDEAVRYMKAVEKCRLQYVEQPMRVRMLDDYAALRSRTGTPVAINEDAYIPGGVLAAWRAGATDAAVVDMESVGGIAELQKIAHAAEIAGLPLAHHCAWDLGVKTAAIIHATSALKAFSMAMDSTYMAHGADILKKPLPIHDGCFDIPDGDGYGIEVDEEMLREYACRDEKRRFAF